MTPRFFKSEAALAAFLAARPGAYDLLILHDDACSPSRCACSPWFEVRDLTVENHLDGQRQQAKWIRETSS